MQHLGPVIALGVVDPQAGPGVAVNRAGPVDLLGGDRLARVSDKSNTFEHSPLVYLEPTNPCSCTTSKGGVKPWLLTPSSSFSSCLILVKSLIFVPVIRISKSPTDIILSEDETERKSTSFTFSFDLERTDEGCSSFVVGGSLTLSAHSPTSLLTYPSPA